MSPAFSSIRIIIRAPGESVFADGFTLIADIGAAEPCVLTPFVMRKGLSMYDLNSVLPPGTFS